MIRFQTSQSPLGELRLVSDGNAITSIEFPGQHGEGGVPQADAILERCQRQLQEYFEGQRQVFELPLAPAGTEFQHQVWTMLSRIPYGELRSYRDIAIACNRPRAMRAVGAANGRNPIPIIVPCHRVIGSNGKLTGYAGGLPAKQLLLKLEGVSG
ncbi:methylated-DNA--[protein]-cysteine S-methyltransferase [Halieaceae bacterium IMCC14734]|uniref:Methylated-DNA--protein-cysteine methyltransferase n=1 Tax=Candidatus Litorirhabdus singularis TaxID=2518993 RepID=A0ABT3TB49_9GAMM|nr:methylated-DNA--[protein]-cysteine S-methyltransferase [Candidatus Litorirhabdus singularis]MCX2979480.1 methylated-DNA--[protein]-cysteine S-methyltransferase [Candidatus Litorirhabdus singularis]